MKNTVTVKLFLILLLMLPVSLSASDFGLVVNSNCGYDNAFTEDNTFNYKVDILPRFSTLVGDNGEFVLSAGFSIANEEGFFYIPEILRTEFNIRFGSSGVRIGRFNFSDPLSFVASGLFDGVQYYQNSNGGSFRVGAWYTGLLYKKRAGILMTDNDEAAFLKPFEYDDFFGTYFASRRVISAVEWEHPSIGEFLRLNTAYVGQTDLNKNDTEYHSQYLIVKAGIPINNFLMEFGGSVEFSRTVTAKEIEFNMAFAGDIGLFLLFPSEFNSRLSFKGTIAGGRTGDFITAFNPITAREYGYILKAKLSGLSIFSLDYSAKFNNFLSGSVTASYFVRNDLGTFRGYPLAENSVEYFLGPEAAAQIIWSPASDLHFKFGGGAFFPSLGDLFSEEKIKGRFDFTVVLSIL
jgi:hypothetical protein